MVERDHFRYDRDVFPGIQRHRDERNLNVEHRGVLVVESGPFDYCVLVPFLEINNDLDPLLLTNRANAEDVRYIDEANAANLHVVALKLVPASDDDVVASPRRDNEIIRDESVAPFDQVENALGFTDAALASEEKANAKYICQRSMQRRGLGEFGFDYRLNASVKLCRLEGGSKHRYFCCGRRLLQFDGWVLILRDDDNRDREPEKHLSDFLALFGRQRVEIRDFSLAENLYPLGDEPADIPGQCEAGAGEIGVGYDPVEANPVVQIMKVERSARSFEELPNAELATHALAASLAARARFTVDALPSDRT